MIRLTKHLKPEVLTRNAERWTREILEKVAAGTKISDAVGSKYNNSEIKAALVEETKGKCAYCESKFLHIAYGDIEHITAKAVQPSLAVEWENLTVACDKCNQKKSSHEGIVDPYEVDPERHFVFLGPILRARPESEAGDLTERLLQLNRSQLVERRLERIDYALSFLRLAEKVTDERLKVLMRQDASRCCASDQEYSAAVSQAVAAF